MTDQTNVVPMALPLSKLAEQLREDIVYTNQGREQWIEGMLRQAQHLREARERFGDDDTAFGKWLRDEKIEIDRNDRQALVTMGADPVVLRAILAKQPKIIQAQTLLRKQDAETLLQLSKVSKSSSRRKRRKIPGVKQAQVSIDIRPELWEQFKASAAKEGLSAAAKLGVLVGEERPVDPPPVGSRRRGQPYIPDVMREDNEGLLPQRQKGQPKFERPVPILKGLKPQEVDPDFKGTTLEFISKYGHVNLHTKEQIEQNKQLEALSTGLGVVADYIRAGRAMRAALAQFDPGTVAVWLRKPGKSEKLQGWIDDSQQAHDALRTLKSS